MRCMAVVGQAGVAIAALSACAVGPSGATVTGARVVYPVADGSYRFIVVTYSVSCPKADLYQLQLDLTEIAASGTSRTRPSVPGVCTGAVQPVSAIVRPLTGTLHPGAATLVTHFAYAPHTAPPFSGTGQTKPVVVR